MPITSVTTTAVDVFFGNANLDSVAFKNVSTAGEIFIRNKQVRQNTVTSTDFEWSLKAGDAIGLSKFVDGDGIIGPFQAISDTGGGVTLAILPIYRGGVKGQ